MKKLDKAQEIGQNAVVLCHPPLCSIPLHSTPCCCLMPVVTLDAEGPGICSKGKRRQLGDWQGDLYCKWQEGKKRITLTGVGFFLISKTRVAPKLSEAMTGFLPNDSSSSLCQSTLSFSFRYRLQRRELKVWLVTSSMCFFNEVSRGCHCNQWNKVKGKGKYSAKIAKVSRTENQKREAKVKQLPPPLPPWLRKNKGYYSCCMCDKNSINYMKPTDTRLPLTFSCTYFHGAVEM